MQVRLGLGGPQVRETVAVMDQRPPYASRDRRAQRWNAAGAVLSLALAVAVAMGAGPTSGGAASVAPSPSSRRPHTRIEPERLGGQSVLRDASHHPVPLLRFERIASASSLADPVLLALCEPERILAFSSRSQRQAPEAHRFSGKPSIDTSHKLERLVTLQPDLVLINSLGNAGHVARLRAAGLHVFDLGEMRGLDSLERSIAQIGWLVGRPARAVRFARRFRRRMHRVAATIPDAERRRGLYLSAHGKTLLGGTRGTSFGDVLESAGLKDAARERFSGWPRYSPEQLLLLDPDVIVTQTNMARTICEHTELGRLRACRVAGGIIELDGTLLSDPGLGMLDAAESIVTRAYPERFEARQEPRGIGGLQ